MRFVRFGPAGSESPGLLDQDGRLRTLAGEVEDVGPKIFAPDTLAHLRSIDPRQLPQVADGTRIGPCIADVSKIICVGLNFSDHAAESGMEVPSEPVLFMKATSAISGPCDDVILPRGSRKADWEVELAVVIGRDARYVSEADAMDHVGGYCVLNDLSEREFQLERCGQWDKGKGCDTFAPLGPWLVTPDEIRDPHDLPMRLSVNGHLFQNGSSRTMIFRIPFLISYISQFMTLKAGDVISTGTPPGVGLGQSPPVYLKAGDVIELEIGSLGRQRQQVVAPWGST